jgi:hypothetical protein
MERPAIGASGTTLCDGVTGLRPDFRRPECQNDPALGNSRSFQFMGYSGFGAVALNPAFAVN